MTLHKILIADDHADNVELVRDILTPLGYDLITAADGLETLAKARSEKPDLVLLDVNMPGCDGYEVVRQLRADPAVQDTAVLMLTALSGIPDLVKGLNLGADDYLAKPFHRHELVARVRARLRIKSLEDQLRGRVDSLYRLFNLYVPSRVAQTLVEEPEHAMLGGSRRVITILFADLHGFTSLAEEQASERVLEFLNYYLTIATNAVFGQEGTLDKFMGDAAMAIFNAPLDQPDHVLRAARAALAIREQLATPPRPAHIPFLEFRMGIHTGDSVVGNIGSTRLLNYTAVGDSVNVAKRLQENAEGGQILMSREVYECIADAVEARFVGENILRGRHHTVQVYELLGLKGAGDA